MLKALHIENMAVARCVDLEPCDKLTVLTGETGAGKSIIIDSINFLLGKRIVRDLVRTGETQARVSAVFSDISAAACEKLSTLGIEPEDGEILIERTQTAEGKGSCRIDGRSVSKQLLREAGEVLVSVHGQNDTHSLDDPSGRTNIIDSLAADGDMLSAYKTVYSEWSELSGKLKSLEKSEAEKRRMADMLEFQVKDISSHRLKEGEEEKLLEERTRLRSMERIRKQTDTALRAIYRNEKGITASFLAERAADALSKISDVIPEYAKLSERLASCRYELDDIAEEAAAVAENLDTENTDEKLDKIESRLEAISGLKRKYGQTVAEIIAFGKNAAEQLEEIENSDALAEEYRKRLKALENDMTQKAQLLSAARREAAGSIEGRITETLRYLDMPGVRFRIEITRKEQPAPDGFDSIEFMLAANPGEPMLPLSKSASGGELSRVMLALKCAVAGADGTGTLIFDEVDTGISGKTSRKVGIKLKEAGESAQVLCVTHSAQIASLAGMHLLVSKQEAGGRTETCVRELDYEGRINETARIIGGISVTDAQRRAAEEMINEYSLQKR